MTDLNPYLPIAESIAKLLRPYAEVVLHDIEENRIEAIFNSFTRRQVGDDSLIDDVNKLTKGPDIHGPFRKTNFDGRRFKSITTVLRNEKGQAKGLLCINLDVSLWTNLHTGIESFLNTAEDSTELDRLFEDDWQTKINRFVFEFLEERGLTPQNLSRQHRVEVVHALHAAGAFRAKNATSFVAHVLGISRATVYNDLSAVNDTVEEGHDETKN